MKKIFLFICTLVCLNAMSQVDTTRTLQPVQGDGFIYKRLKVTGSLEPAQDTFKLKSTDRAIAFKGLVCYLWNGIKWNPIGTGGSGTVTQVTAGNAGPLFTTTVNTNLTTPEILFTISPTIAYSIYGNNGGTTGAPSFFSPVLASNLFANQGTSTTFLRGNASGAPSWSSVDVGDLPYAFPFSVDLTGNAISLVNDTAIGTPATPFTYGYNSVSQRLQYSPSLNFIFTNPQPLDNLVIGSDANTIVNATITPKTGIIGNVSVIDNGNLNYTVLYPGGYTINGAFFPGGQGTIQLPVGTAGVDSGRVDLIELTAAGAGSEQGSNSDNPQAPVPDLQTTIPITTVLILSNATVAAPVNTSTNRLVYNEHIASPTETTVSTTNVTANADAATAGLAFNGTKYISITSFTANTGRINFTFPDTLTKSNYTNLNGYIRINTAWNAATQYSVSLVYGATVSNAVPLTTWGIVKGTTGSYQPFSIPMSAFTGSPQFTAIRITRTGTGGTVNWLLDYITLQGLGVSVGVNPTTIYTGDGKLLSNRIVLGNLHTLTFDSLQSFTARSTDLNVTSLTGLAEHGTEFTRTTYFSPSAHLNVKFTFGNKTTWNIGANDSTNLNPQNRDGIAGLKNEIAFGKNPAYTGRSVIMSGTGAGDAVAALHAQAGIYSSSGNRFYFRNGLGGVTSYLLSGDGSIQDTVENWYGFTSGGGGTLTPKVLKWYDFYGGVGSPHADSIWGLAIQSGVVGAGTIARNYIQGPLALGGYHTGPTNQLEVYGTVQIKDGTECAGCVLTTDANGVTHWELAGSGVGGYLPLSFAGDNTVTTNDNALLIQSSAAAASSFISLNTTDVFLQSSIDATHHTFLDIGGAGATWNYDNSTTGNHTRFTLSDTIEFDNGSDTLLLEAKKLPVGVPSRYTKMLVYDPAKGQIGQTGISGAGGLVAANNLSDVSSAATSRTNLGATTVGSNLFTLSNPSAIRFVRLNADNSVTARTAAELLSDIGAQAALPVTITRGSTAARNALTPTEGDLSYDTTLHAWFYWDGTNWVQQ